jgi:hypothetical protein
MPELSTTMASTTSTTANPISIAFLLRVVTRYPCF